MMAIRHAARGPSTSLLRQVALSVAATLIATAILTEAQHEYGVWRRVAVQPAVTSGGKFAARVEALSDAADDADAILLPPAQTVPLLAEVSTPMSLPVVADHPIPAKPPMARPVGDLARNPRHVARSEPKRHGDGEMLAGVLPPRRADSLVETVNVTTPHGTVESLGSTDLWTATADIVATSGTAMKRAVEIGGDWLDRVVPSGFAR